MWWTPEKKRILKGAEAEVFANAILRLIDDLSMAEEAGENCKTNVKVFDNLTFNQKISILQIIAKGLLQSSVLPVKLTALNEGAIAAVYAQLENDVYFEIDELPRRYRWRRLVRKALAECEYTHPPLMKCKIEEDWWYAITYLSELILWDTDYAFDHIPDMSPEESQSIKKNMGIDDDYFVDVAEDPDNREIEKKIKNIERICNKIISKKKK